MGKERCQGSQSGLLGLQMLSLSDQEIFCSNLSKNVVHMESIEKKGGKEEVAARLVGLQMLSLSDWPIEAFSLTVVSRATSPRQLTANSSVPPRLVVALTLTVRKTWTKTEAFSHHL